MTEVVLAFASPSRSRPARPRLTLLMAFGLLIGCQAAAESPTSHAAAAAPSVPILTASALTATGGATGAGGIVPPSGMAWGRAELCAEYCSCMGSGKCTGRQPANCMATCTGSAANWNIPCRIEKCKSANKDYSDQISGSCATAAGLQGCWDKDKLLQAQ